ncbi:hypothetical protein VTH06DRAFT_4396 [Thermothelomyces fergusii]
MDPNNEQPSEYWTRRFVEAAQSEQQKRENHTADVAESIRLYSAAAAEKIAAALGPEADNLLPNANGNPGEAAGH